jgi:tRNA A-37 threonylcarbamoyl transferase component Bud32/dipeptidyl aminopeptidase/acylaminoacyl peptidase
MSLKPSTRLGPYEIVSAIGAGGMGEVYRAKDTKLNRDVAIKVLPDLFATDTERLARFTREAQTLASLNHPNIAQIYGIEGTALVMELVEGEDLSEVIARHGRSAPAAAASSESSSRGAAASGDGAPRVIEIDDALRIAKQIAEALEAAHDAGIVHRDLKPANIKVRADGTVKVLDFGLAKAMDPAGASGASASNSPTLTAHATAMGMIMGTAAYMAPEQAKGKSVDKRADIWAFGVVLYEMLSGQRGYEAEDVSDTLAAVLTREVDWTKLPASTPPRLVGLLHDCLVRDPKQRLRDMGEARRVLDQLITGNSGSTIIAPASSTITIAAPPAPLWRRALPWAIAAAAVLIAGAATWRSIAAPVRPRAPVTRSRLVFKELAGLVDVSRDGTQIVYIRAGGAQGFHLELRHMDQFEGLPLPGTDGGVIPVFSPAGDWVAFSTVDNKIKKTPSGGGPAITLTDGSFFDGATWGDDDTIVYSSPKGLIRMPASGGAPESVTTINKNMGETRHIRPQFLPGGHQLLFTVTYASADPQFAVLDLKKGGYRTVARSGDNGRYAAGGYLLCARAGTLFARPFDLDRVTATGPEAPVVEGVSSVGPNAGVADYALSETGLLIYFESVTQGGTTLTWRDRKGIEIPLPGQMSRLWGTGTLSPDGHHVANAILADKGSDIWVVDLSRGAPTRLTFGGANDNPIWTPDERAIVYAGNKDGKPGVYKVAADGSGQPQLVLAGAEAAPTSFTPNGKTLLFTQPGPNGKARIMVLPLDAAGGTASPYALRESSAADNDGQISPDGKWVAFTSAESGRREVYVLPFPGPGPKVQISSDGGERERWSADGRELLFWDTVGNATLMSAAIKTPPFSNAPAQKLFTAFSGTTWGVAPDAQHFLVETVANGGTLVTVTNWFDELRRRAPVKK